MSWVRSPLAAPTCRDRRGFHEQRWPNCPIAVKPESKESKENKELELKTAGQPEWLTDFVPRRGLSNGHLQTIVGNYLPRPPFRVDAVAETVEVDPADGSRVLCHCH